MQTDAKGRLVVSLDDMIDFVRQQPITRQVNFDENKTGDACGCIMVQFALANGIPFETACCHSWCKTKKLSDECSAYFDDAIKFHQFMLVHNLVGYDMGRATNYGMVRIAIRQYFGIVI